MVGGSPGRKRLYSSMSDSSFVVAGSRSSVRSTISSNAEELDDLLARLGQAEGAHQQRRRLLALAVDTHGQDVALVGLELEPRAAVGMTFAFNSVLSDVLSRSEAKYTPGERTSWETTTRSVPLMMNVPRGVMSGKSPMKTSCSLISPVSRLMKRISTNSGAW